MQKLPVGSQGSSSPTSLVLVTRTQSDTGRWETQLLIASVTVSTQPASSDSLGTRCIQVKLLHHAWGPWQIKQEPDLSYFSTAVAKHHD